MKPRKASSPPGAFAGHSAKKRWAPKSPQRAVVRSCLLGVSYISL